MSSGNEKQYANSVLECAALKIGSTTLNESDLTADQGITPGTVTASKAVVVDSNRDIATLHNVTSDGTVAAVDLTGLQSGGVERPVYDISADNTLQLTAVQSGGLIQFRKATGCVVTLPAAAAGLFFDFHVYISVTSNAYKVITKNTGTEFIGGLMVSVDTDSANALAYDQVGNGAASVAINMNGTTTGGLVYTQFRLTCLSSILWMVTNGMNFGSGVVATPFAAS